MENLDGEIKPSLVTFTAEIVSAYVANNSVQRSDIVALIASVHDALQSVSSTKKNLPVDRPVPAVSVKKSISADYLISLEDGRRYKSLRRHLNGQGMTPEQYREKWGLAYDYPMVAPNYAKQRSDLAKSMGLGRQRPAPEPVQAAPAAVAAGNGRRKGARRTA